MYFLFPFSSNSFFFIYIFHSDQQLSELEVIYWFDNKATKRGLKKSQDEVNKFVSKLFTEFGRDNKLTVTEFICALPELITELLSVAK